jgi:hypothetical protein
MSKMSNLLIELEHEGIDITDEEAVAEYIKANIINKD